MRRIDISPYTINAANGQSPAEKLDEFLSTAQGLVIKRLAKERLGIKPRDFDVMVMEELSKPAVSVEAPIPYDVRNSLIEILFHPNLALGAKDILDRDTLARRIKDWPDNTLLLEEEDYKKVLAGMEALRGLGRHDTAFVRRVLEAPQIEVQAKTKTKALAKAVK